jgi:hypothetical protein
MTLQSYRPNGTGNPVQALAIQFTPNPNATCGQSVVITKAVCNSRDTGLAGDSTTDVTGKRLSVTLELVPFANSTEIYEDPGGDGQSIPGPGTGTYLSSSISNGTGTTQVMIELSIYNYPGLNPGPPPSCSVASATIYIQDIHFF